MSSSYADALTFAAIAHMGQVRKGTTIPYITHPVAVSELVARHGGDEEQMMAALLHDTLEDCPEVTLTELNEAFGRRVGVIVSNLSDGFFGMKAPWRERKESYLEHLREVVPDILLVSACDKLHNASCIVQDLKDGVDVFARFSAGREGTLWYYASLAKIFRERLIDKPLLSGAITSQVAAMIKLGVADEVVE